MESIDSTSTEIMETRIDFHHPTHVSIVSFFPQNTFYNTLTSSTELDLPEYDDYESLKKALYTAMTAGGEYFGFA